MSWIQTYSGKQFWPLEPLRSEIDIHDIAHSLSLQCRFNGHCTAFYSVAEHSVRVSRVVPPEHALWGLLHDAAEAYLADLPRPVKQQVPLFVQLEDHLLEHICVHFGLTWPMPDSVRLADDVMLATEHRDLMLTPPASWGLTAQALPDVISPLGPAEAKAAFLDRFAELTSSSCQPG